MADNRGSEKMEEQITNMNISNVSCSSEVISPQTTTNDDSDNGDIENSTCSKSGVVETEIICSDNQKSECNIITPKNTNFKSNEKSPDHSDTIVKSNDNESNLKGINDNDGDSNKVSSSRNDWTDAHLSELPDIILPTDNIFSSLNSEQAEIYIFMNSNSVARHFINETSVFDQSIVTYEYDEIDEIVDHRRTTEEHFYLVKWKNWSQGFNTWERFEALLNVQKLILKFLKEKHNFKKPVNIMHLMLSRQIISQLFEQFRTPIGLSLPLTPLEDISELCNIPVYGTAREQQLRKMALRSHFAVLSLDFFRQQQYRELKQWEMEINLFSRNCDIRVENNMDLENPPISFVYIIDYYIPEGKIIIPDNSLSGCLCIKNCSLSANCCTTLSGSVVYDEHKKLMVTPECPIFECNKKCKCLSSCVNRVVQHGSEMKVAIYKTMYLGWALKTCQNIQKGQFVGIYIGEIITIEENDQRLQDSTSSVDYTWELDFNDTNNFKYIVDSTHYGNFTRFINHSCEANLNIHSVWINCLEDKYFPHLALFANRDILADEELTTDYFFRRGKNYLKKSGIKCKCNTPKCKGYFF